jgi:hypothetical protein
MSRLKMSLQVLDPDLSREDAPLVVARAIMWAGDGFAGYYESNAENVNRHSATVVSTLVTTLPVVDTNVIFCICF